MSYSKQKSLIANVEAIETAMKIRVQDRPATVEEKEILSRYSGFDGIKEVLNIGTDNPIGSDMEEPIQRLRGLINTYPYFTEPMRNNVIESIKASVLTAFYTPNFLVDAVARQIHATFEDNGLQMRSFLEPSAGIGGFLPVTMSGTYDYAIEKDLVSGLILSLLHDNAVTRVAAFETIGEQDFEHKTFDVIASNIPFGNFRVFDVELWKKGGIYEQATKTIHNYFFVKATHTRKAALSQREQMFLQVSREKTDVTGTIAEYTNNLFTLPKTTLSTSSRMTMNQYGKYARKYLWQGDENAISQYLAALLKLDFARCFRKSLFNEDGQNEAQTQMSLFGNIAIKPTPKGKRSYTDEWKHWMKNGAMVLFEGQVGIIQHRKSDHYEEMAIDFVPVDESKVNMERAKDYFHIREAYFELSAKEQAEQKEYPDLRTQLNTRYDAFVAKWGYFHENDNKEFIMLDSLGVEVFTIEMQVGKDICKSDIMREPVAFKKIDTSVQLTSTEALASCLNFHGKVDMNYLIRSTGVASRNLHSELGFIFSTPPILK